jgi:hypothetical protein
MTFLFLWGSLRLRDLAQEELKDCEIIKKQKGEMFRCFSQNV